MADRAPSKVGPVLHAGPSADAILDAIRALNPGVEVLDRGAYLRVLARRRCVVTRAAIEERLGRPFSLLRELEANMPSFAGRLRLSDEEASWAEE